MEAFRFSKSERIASLVILILTLAILLILARMRRVHPLSEEEARVFDSLISNILPDEDSSGVRRKPARRNLPVSSAVRISRRQPPPVRDPNTMTKDQWEELPLPPYVIRTLLNYRSKGGVFRGKEDVKKIYGMTDSLYGMISPYLTVAKPARGKDTLDAGRDKIPAASPSRLVEINRADSAAFDSLPGIPSFLAGRIVRYRKLLGGFVRKEQLLEVYGFDTLKYEKIKERVAADTSLVRKIDVNVCDVYTLARHPYLTRQEAEAVIFYRDHFGKIKKLQRLTEKNVLPEKTFRKVSPYLKTGGGN